MNEFNLEKEPHIKAGFKVPDNYFEDFSARVMLQLPENEPKVIALFSYRKKWVYAVAAVVVIALSIPILYIIPSTTTELDKVTLENYLTHTSDLSEDDLAEFLNEADLQKINFNATIEYKAIEDLLSSNANLEEYLVN